MRGLGLNKSSHGKDQQLRSLHVIAAALIVTYKEWVGKAIATFLVWVVAKMIRARQERIDEKCNELIVYTASEQTTVVHFYFKGPQAMVVLSVASIFLAVVPMKVVIMGAILYYFTMTLVSKLGKSEGSNEGFNRRLKEWWDSIPVIPVHVVDEVPNSPNRIKCTQAEG